jgi:hypothetical protein
MRSAILPASRNASSRTLAITPKKNRDDDAQFGHIPTPADVDRVDDWQAGAPLPYRVLVGELRTVDGLDVDRVSVQPTAIQLSDGRIDDGSVYEAPQVYLIDDALSSAQPRALAAALLVAADEADGWAAK